MTTKRLRIVPVPGDSVHYLVVLDRMTMEGAAESEHLRDLGDTLTGCAGVLVFADEVEVSPTAGQVIPVEVADVTAAAALRRDIADLREIPTISIGGA